VSECYIECECECERERERENNYIIFLVLCPGHPSSATKASKDSQQETCDGEELDEPRGAGIRVIILRLCLTVGSGPTRRALAAVGVSLPVLVALALFGLRIAFAMHTIRRACIG